MAAEAGASAAATARPANRALFDDDVEPDRYYLIVDDFVGQGGTLANIIGYVRSKGGNVLGASFLAGRDFSSKITPSYEQIQELRVKHGKEFENWWQEIFGFGFDQLTRSEDGYLINSSDAKAIRAKIIEAGSFGLKKETSGCGGLISANIKSGK